MYWIWKALCSRVRVNALEKLGKTSIHFFLGTPNVVTQISQTMYVSHSQLHRTKTKFLSNTTFPEKLLTPHRSRPSLPWASAASPNTVWPFRPRNRCPRSSPGNDTGSGRCKSRCFGTAVGRKLPGKIASHLVDYTRVLCALNAWAPGRFQPSSP